MKKEKKYIDKLISYYNQTIPFLHEQENEEWMYLLEDVMNVLDKLENHKARYLVCAMFYIITSGKEYTEEEQEIYYRKMRVWTRIEDVKTISIEMIDFLLKEENGLPDEDAFRQLLEVFEGSNIEDVHTYDESFTMTDLYLLQEEKGVNKNRIEYIEGLFFEGRLTKHPQALDVAFTILLVEPFAYHVLIFVMDYLLKDGINTESIAFLEAFADTFEKVEKDWLEKESNDLSTPSDLREYCFGLSSIAMYYLEEENYKKAIIYYEKLLAIDKENIFHSREYILRAYMFNNQFDKYSDSLDMLPEQSVYKRFLILYRKIQLVEPDMETYLEDTIKHYGYLLKLLVEEEETDLSALPEIEEDFLIEYGSLFLEDKKLMDLIKEFLKNFNFIA